MNKQEKLAAFEGIDTDILEGSEKNKQIVKMFLQGMTYKEIGAQFELSSSRIGQILDNQANLAISYKTNNNYEVTKQHQALLSYLTNYIFNGDELRAQSLCKDIQEICQNGFSINAVFYKFYKYGINFKHEEQATKVMQLIMDLANNTRCWENNGHTPKEITNTMKSEQAKAKSDKTVGRNEPCPCGSGKKYKKCCGGT